MDLLLAILAASAGLCILFFSANIIIKSSISLAKKLDINPLFIGLIVVGAGTSTPEIAASFSAALKGTPDIALGNIIGSNIFNLLFIGGIATLICKQHIEKSLLKFDFPALMIASLVMIFCFSDGNLTPSEGFLFIGIFALYIVLIYFRSKKDKSHKQLEFPAVYKNSFVIAAALIMSLAGLAFGAKISIDGAIALGAYLNISDRIIGLTVVSIGTGLPELVTALVAAQKKQSFLVFPNIIGSNIINTLGIPAAASVLKTIPVAKTILSTDSVLLILATLFVFAMIILNRLKVPSWQGGILIALYVAFFVNISINIF